MVVYSLIILITFSFACLVQSFMKKYNIKYIQNKIVYYFLFLLCIIPPTLVSGFRNTSVGTDTAMYKAIFFQLKSGALRPDLENGYVIINQLIGCFTDSYYWSFFVMALLFCYFSFKAIFEQSPLPALSILLFFLSCSYNESMNMVRQSLAMAIFCYSIKFIANKKLFKYIFCIFCASLFHRSIIIVLPLYFIDKIVFKRNTYILLACMYAVCVKYIRDIIIYFVSLIPSFNMKYSSYFGSVFDSGSEGDMFILMNICIFIFVLYFYKANKNDTKYRLIINFVFLSVIASISILQIPLANRITTIFMFPYMIFIPMCINYFSNKSSRYIISIVIVAMFAIYYMLKTPIFNYSDVLPYLTCFN